MVLNEMIEHDLQNAPLLLKTGDTGYLNVEFFTAEGDNAGLVAIHIPSKLYRFGTCPTRFPSTLPPGEEKVWTVTKLPGPRMTLHCNGELVVDELISEDACSIVENWSRDVEQLKFLSGDNFFYKSQPGN